MSVTELIAVLALTGYAVYKQTHVHEVTGRSRFKLAIIYAAVGIVLGVHVAHTAGALGLLVVSIAASLVVGLIRGRHSRMWTDGGRVYTQGTVFTVGIFLALIAFKFALGTFAYFAHISYGGGLGEILLMIGVMLAVQAEITWRRAQTLGAATVPAMAGTAR